MAMADIEMNHIPYKGTSQSLQDVITGRVPVMIDNLAPILPHIQSGALIAIGVSTAGPVALLPGVPPIGTVVKGYQASSWNALSVPAKTPREIVTKLSTRGQRHPAEARRHREIPRGRLRAGRRHAGGRRKVLRRGARALEARRRRGEACRRL